MIPDMVSMVAGSVRCGILVPLRANLEPKVQDGNAGKVGHDLAERRCRMSPLRQGWQFLIPSLRKWQQEVEVGPVRSKMPLKVFSERL